MQVRYYYTKVISFSNIYLIIKVAPISLKYTLHTDHLSKYFMNIYMSKLIDFFFLSQLTLTYSGNIVVLFDLRQCSSLSFTYLYSHRLPQAHTPNYTATYLPFQTCRLSLTHIHTHTYKILRS